MEFTITAANGDSVKVVSDNWMLAMGKALPFFRIDVHELEQITCRAMRNGGVRVEAGDGVSSWDVRPIAPALTIVASARSESMSDRADPEPEVDLLDEPTNVGPAPNLVMPTHSTLAREAAVPLAERLWDMSMDLASETVPRACRVALDLILEFVPAEAASVARGTLNDPSLKFVAATGPVADQILGRQVRFGEGLVGMSFDMGATIHVGDVSTDTRHLDQVDLDTGFTTLAALCVPVIDDDGLAHAVIQLLNPPQRAFTQAHVDVVESVARTLAAALAART